MAEMFQPAPAPKTSLGRYRVLSKTAGIRVSPLQLGAMSIGDAWNDFMGSMNKVMKMRFSRRGSIDNSVGKLLQAARRL